MSETKPKVKNALRNKDHDDFVRGLLSYTEFVFKILQYSLPDDLKPFIDFSTLTKSSDTHIDEVLDITYSDTLYRAKLNKEAIPKAYRRRRKFPDFSFGFLVEAKSGIPPIPIDFQLDGYIRSVQLDDLNNGREASIVIGILLYHGPRRWRFKRLRDQFAQFLPQVILDYIPYPKYIIIDLNALPDEDIAAALDLGELRAAFIALKHAHDKTFFQNNLEEILKFAETSKPSLLFQTYMRMVMEYAQRRSKLDGKEFKKIIEQLKPEKEMATKFKSIFEVVKEEGIAIGETKGIAIGETKGIAIGEAKGIAIGEAKGIAIGEAKANQKVQEAKRQTVIRLIRTTKMENISIAEVVDVPIALVEEIRLEISMGKA